jgi:transcriptional regulator with XRE-family HTH domain
MKSISIPVKESLRFTRNIQKMQEGKRTPVSTMDSDTLGTLLRQWRERRGLSQSALAQRAGVAASTVSRWESGRTSPNLPELEAGLRALDVPPEHARQALRLLKTPRAQRRLQQVARISAAASPTISAPGGGELLRAMRLRRAMTQAQLAALLGVSQNFIARWERSRGEVWPDTARLQELCFYLGASEQEFLALTQGRFTLASVMEETDPEALHRIQWTLRLEPEYAPDAPLKDLRFLALESRLHTLLSSTNQTRGTQDRLQRLLSWTYSRHAEYLQNVGRVGEATEPARYAIDLQKSLGSTRNDEGWVPAVLALSANKIRTEGTHRSGLALLHRALRDVKSIDYQAWVLVRMARCALGAGLKDEAVELSGRALTLVRQGDLLNFTAESRLRLRDHASCLLAVGRAAEAAAYLPENSGEQWLIAQDQNVRDLLLQTAILKAVGQPQEAGIALRRCYSLIETLELVPQQASASRPPPSPLRLQADSLANDLV